MVESFQTPKDLKTLLEVPAPQSGEPKCPKCGDTGWQVISSNGTEAVRLCSCQQGSERNRLLLGTGIPSVLWRCTIKRFKTYIDNKTLASALAAAKDFIKGYPAVNQGLMFSGPAGSGKTHLAVAILISLALEKNARVLYLNHRELLENLKDGFDNRDANLQILRDADDAEVLLLDDLGAAQSTEWSRDVLAKILYSRQKASRRLLLATTVFPDSGAPGQLLLSDRISPQLRSLLYELCRTVVINAPDYRQEVLSRRQT